MPSSSKLTFSLSQRVVFLGLLLGSLVSLALIMGLPKLAVGDEESEQVQRYPSQLQYRPTPVPDRIVLTWSGDPATSVDVTWRTDTSINISLAEFTEAKVDSNHSTGGFDGSQRVAGTWEKFKSDLGASHYHTVKLEKLKPATKYVYRVGDGVNWSEWFQFQSASDQAEPFTFIYFGDSQNSVRSLWSRVIREAHAEAPRAAFMLHAGDLVDDANSDADWGEWFAAGSWLNAMIPTVVTPGNHEYNVFGSLSRHWRPQFSLPLNGPSGLEESTYWFDYQGVRFISLNSNQDIDDQTEWLEQVLADNLATWTVVTLHHPVFSSRNRDSTEIHDAWRPLFEKYGVDLVLQGHEHTYARSGLSVPENAASGANLKRGQTVYVVSISGPKMYDFHEQPYFKRSASGAQLFQIIRIDGQQLEYEARLVTGELYDSFVLQKKNDRTTELFDHIPDTPKIKK